MIRNDSNISKEKITRYLENQMSEQERNAFEKELERNPFEKEALEGFATISSESLNTQLHVLNTTFVKQKKKRFSLMAAAAVVLLLISSGIVFNLLQQKSLTPTLAESKTEQQDNSFSKKPDNNKPTPIVKNQTQQTETIIEQPDAENEEIRAAEPSPRVVEIKKSKQASLKPDSNEELSLSIMADDLELETNETIISAVAPAPKATEQDIPASDLEPNKLAKNKTKTNSSTVSNNSSVTVRGKIISAKDGQPLPGATLVQKGTQEGTVSDVEGNFKLELQNDTAPITAQFIGMEQNEFLPNSNEDHIIALQEQSTELSEVVTIGYGTKKKRSVVSENTVNTSESNSDAQPVEGMDAYQKYLDKNAILPKDFKSNKEIVKVILKISNTGNISEIANKNNADATVFKWVKQLIFEGPVWQAEIKNGKPKASEIQLKIVFRKAK